MATVKIAFRDDIRRVTVSDFASLLVSVGLAYKLENFVLKYQDEDSDWVSVSSAEEFDEAVRAVDGKKVLKLCISVPKSLQENKEPIVQNNGVDANNNDKNVYTPSLQAKEQQPEALPSLFPPLFESSLPASPSCSVASAPPLDPLDHGIDCQNCRVRIIGTLYQCTMCPNTSICAACEEHNVHDSTHTLIKVRAPVSKCKAQRREEKNGKRRGKWTCNKLAKLRRFAVPVVFVAVLRHLPFMLCLLALWAGFHFMQKRRALLKVCSECTHNEKCRVGKKAKRMAKGGGCGLVPKILFAMACLLVRILPIWLLVGLFPLAMCVRSKVHRAKKGACMNNFKGNMDSLCGRYKDILLLNWPQLMHRVQQNQVPRGGLPQSMMGCAAVAASESLAASVAAVVALSESVAAELGVTIPVAVPVSAAAYAQQIRVLKEMGFEDSAALQQLLVKHSGDVQAVISEVMQLQRS